MDWSNKKYAHKKSMNGKKVEKPYVIHWFVLYFHRCALENSESRFKQWYYNFKRSKSSAAAGEYHTSCVKSSLIKLYVWISLSMSFFADVVNCFQVTGPRNVLPPIRAPTSQQAYSHSAPNRKVEYRDLLSDFFINRDYSFLFSHNVD